MLLAACHRRSELCSFRTGQCHLEGKPKPLPSSHLRPCNYLETSVKTQRHSPPEGWPSSCELRCLESFLVFTLNAVFIQFILYNLPLYSKAGYLRLCLLIFRKRLFFSCFEGCITFLEKSLFWGYTRYLGTSPC